MAINLEGTRFGDLGEFVIACVFIVSVCKVLLTRILERTNRQRSFLNYGPAPFMG